jgi:hypothetical protein
MICGVIVHWASYGAANYDVKPDAAPKSTSPMQALYFECGIGSPGKKKADVQMHFPSMYRDGPARVGSLVIRPYINRVREEARSRASITS